jgi:GNAT superfamily N-acetyltransferase
VQVTSGSDLNKFSCHLLQPERFALVDRFYRAQGYKVKCSINERVYIIVDEHAEFIAAVRLLPQSSGHYWLRNLLVAKAWRSRGLAKQLLRYLLNDIAPIGCYFFALPQLTDFYLALGFSIDPDDCPDDILRLHNTYRSRGRDWVLMGYCPEGGQPEHFC